MRGLQASLSFALRAEAGRSFGRGHIREIPGEDTRDLPKAIAATMLRGMSVGQFQVMPGTGLYSPRHNGRSGGS